MENNRNMIDLKIPADLHFSAGVRECVSEFCEYNQFAGNIKNQLKLIIDELFMNSVRYGSAKGALVIVKLEYKDKKIFGKVEDFGGGKNKVTVEDLKKIIVHQTNNNVITKTSGRGLAQIVNRWTDKMEIENNKEGGIRLTFEKTVEQDENHTREKPNNLLEIKTTDLKEHVFKFEGEINQENIVDNQKRVNEFLDEHVGDIRMVLDFSDLYYCNSLFIGQIADWYNKIKKGHGEIVILNPNSDILDIIDMVGLTKIIPIQQTQK